MENHQQFAVILVISSPNLNYASFDFLGFNLLGFNFFRFNFFRFNFFRFNFFEFLLKHKDESGLACIEGLTLVIMEVV
jgi:hypothetical protein